MVQTAWRGIRAAFGADVEKIECADKYFKFNAGDIEAGVTNAVKLLKDLPMFELLMATPEAREAIRDILNDLSTSSTKSQWLDPKTGAPLITPIASAESEIKQIHLLQAFIDRVFNDQAMQDFQAISQAQYELDRWALETRHKYGKEISAQRAQVSALGELESKLQSDFQQTMSGIQSTIPIHPSGRVS